MRTVRILLIILGVVLGIVVAIDLLQAKEPWTRLAGYGTVINPSNANGLIILVLLVVGAFILYAAVKEKKINILTTFIVLLAVLALIGVESIQQISGWSRQWISESLAEDEDLTEVEAMAPKATATNRSSQWPSVCGEPVHLTVKDHRWIRVHERVPCSFSADRSRAGGVLLVRINGNDATTKRWQSGTELNYTTPTSYMDFRLEAGNPVSVRVTFPR